MHHSRNKGGVRAAAAGLTIAVLAGISACGGAASSSGSSSASGGTLTIVEGSAPSSLDPAKINAGPATQYTDLAYSSLFSWQNNTSDPTPDLAESYQWIGTGNTHFEIKLRNDVEFSDGTKLTAQAEKEYLEYFMNANGAMSGVAKSVISKIETPSAQTIDIYYKTAHPDAPIDFSEGGTYGSPISSKALQDDKSELGYDTFGAGPYMLDSAETVSGSTYTYVPNPHYFTPSQQRWSKVVVKVIANANSALQAVETSQNGFTAGTHQQEASAKSTGLAVVTGTPDIYMLMLTDRAGKITPALGNEKVRQALNYAVDRSSLAGLLHGTANEQIIAAGRAGSYSGQLYPYDVAKAKQLLASAGYPHGFSFSVLVPSYDSNASQAAQTLVADFQQIGVTVNLVTAPTFEQFQSLQGEKKYSADVESWGTTTMSQQGQQLVLPTGNLNIWQDSDAQLNALYGKAAAESGAAATATWTEFGKEVAEKAWYVPLFTLPTTFYATKSVKLTDVGYPIYPNPVNF